MGICILKNGIFFVFNIWVVYDKNNLLEFKVVLVKVIGLILSEGSFEVIVILLVDY